MNQTFESPIEYILVQYIVNNPIIRDMGLRVRTQVPIGNYRADIVMYTWNWIPLFIVECDGKYFHSSASQVNRDIRRSREIKRLTNLDTIRFTGKQINSNAYKCVEKIITYMQYGIKPKRQW